MSKTKRILKHPINVTKLLRVCQTNYLNFCNANDIFCSLILWDVLIAQGRQLLRKPSCFILKASTMNRCTAGFVALAQCCVRASVPQQFWRYRYSALRSQRLCRAQGDGKNCFFTALARPCVPFCPCYARPEESNRWPDLSHRPARAVLPADGPFPALLFPGAPRLWGRGQVAGRRIAQVAGRRVALAATSLFSATVFLVGPTASPENLMLL